MCGMVSLYVCVSETLMYPAKTAGPIDMPRPIGMRGGVGPQSDVLDGGLDPPGEGAILEWGRASYSKV